MISIIVAVDRAYAIGRQGGLLCHLPDDLKHFQSVTTGHTVIMGERTYNSLPVRPLPHRCNIVLTDIPERTFEGAQAAYSIPEVLSMVSPDEEAFIIGGGMIYRQFEPLAHKLYITHIDHCFEDADTFFPIIDPQRWALDSSDYHPADDRHPYSFTFAQYRLR